LFLGRGGFQVAVACQRLCFDALQTHLEDPYG